MGSRRRSTKTRKRQRCRRVPRSKIIQYLVIMNSVGLVTSQHSQGYKNGESIVKKCCYNTTQTTDVRILQIIGENNVTLSPQNPRITEHHKACREEQPKLNFSRYVNNTLCCKVKVFDENNTVAYTEVFECETFSRLNGTDVPNNNSANVTGPVDNTPTDAITSGTDGNGDGGGGVGGNVPAIVGGVIGGVLGCILIIVMIVIVVVVLRRNGQEGIHQANEVNALQCTSVPEQNDLGAVPVGVCSSQERDRDVSPSRGKTNAVPPKDNGAHYTVTNMSAMIAKVDRNDLRRRHNGRHSGDAEPTKTVLYRTFLQPFKELPEFDCDEYKSDFKTRCPQQESSKGVDTSMVICPRVTVLEEDSILEREDWSSACSFTLGPVKEEPMLISMLEDEKKLQSCYGYRKRIINNNLDNLQPSDFIQSTHKYADSSDTKYRFPVNDHIQSEVTV